MRRLLKLCTLLLLTAYCSLLTAAAQPAHLAGRAVDAATGAALTQVQITGESFAGGTFQTSAPHGDFAVAVAPGRWQLTFVAPRRLPRTLVLDLTAGGEWRGDVLVAAPDNKPYRLLLGAGLLNLRVGETWQLQHAVVDAAGRFDMNAPIAWLPSEVDAALRPACVRVSGTGLVTAVAAGRCAVQALAPTPGGLIAAQSPVLVTVVSAPPKQAPTGRKTK